MCPTHGFLCTGVPLTAKPRLVGQLEAIQKRPCATSGVVHGWSANRNVWSAALSQAKNEVDRMVCANVFGLLLEHKLLALMECAARSSYLVMQPWKAFPVYRFRARRVRPLGHFIG